MIFFFNDTATTEIYTLSLHDALPIVGLDNLGEVDPRKDVTVGRDERSLVQVLLGVLYTARGPQGTLLHDVIEREPVEIPVRKVALDEIGRASCRERV